jgi:hypothetical protein
VQANGHAGKWNVKNCLGDLVCACKEKSGKLEHGCVHRRGRSEAGCAGGTVDLDDVSIEIGGDALFDLHHSFPE